MKSLHIHIHNNVNDADKFSLSVAKNSTYDETGLSRTQASLLAQAAKNATRNANSKQTHYAAYLLYRKASDYYQQLGNETKTNYNRECYELDKLADFHYKNYQN